MTQQWWPDSQIGPLNINNPDAVACIQLAPFGADFCDIVEPAMVSRLFFLQWQARPDTRAWLLQAAVTLSYRSPCFLASATDGIVLSSALLEEWECVPCWGNPDIDRKEQQVRQWALQRFPMHPRQCSRMHPETWKCETLAFQAMQSESHLTILVQGILHQSLVGMLEMRNLARFSVPRYPATDALYAMLTLHVQGRIDEKIKSASLMKDDTDIQALLTDWWQAIPEKNALDILHHSWSGVRFCGYLLYPRYPDAVINMMLHDPDFYVRSRFASKLSDITFSAEVLDQMMASDDANLRITAQLHREYRERQRRGELV